MWLNVFVLISGLWLFGLTLFLWQTRRHYRRLIRRTGKENIDGILNRLLEETDKNAAGIKSAKGEIGEIIERSRNHLNRIALVSFNPFGRSEGEKSFVLAVLDDGDDGMVMNFIYTHDGLRVYSKLVKDGTGRDYPLSKEEEEAVSKAK